MPMYDYECEDCGHADEFIRPSDSKKSITCPKCGKRMSPVWRNAPKQMVTVIPSYPGCKRQKAGYMHSHGDRPAEKVQGRGWSK